MSGRNPPSYCTLTLIAMQGHQQKGRQNNTSSNNKDKYNTIIETRTAEDHDDENLHNPETVQDAVIHLEVDEELLESTFKYQSQHGLLSIELRWGFANDHASPVAREASWSSKQPQPNTVNSKSHVWVRPDKIFRWIKCILN